MEHKKSTAVTVNWILMGLVMLIPGLLKIFVIGPSNVAGMLGGFAIFAWAPTFWAWLLIAAEIVSGVMILAKKQMYIWATVAAIILIVASFTAYLGDWTNMLVHWALASNFLMLAMHKKKK